MSQRKCQNCSNNCRSSQRKCDSCRSNRIFNMENSQDNPVIVTATGQSQAEKTSFGLFRSVRKQVKIEDSSSQKKTPTIQIFNESTPNSGSPIFNQPTTNPQESRRSRRYFPQKQDKIKDSTDWTVQSFKKTAKINSEVSKFQLTSLTDGQYPRNRYRQKRQASQTIMNHEKDIPKTPDLSSGFSNTVILDSDRGANLTSKCSLDLTAQNWKKQTPACKPNRQFVNLDLASSVSLSQGPNSTKQIIIKKSRISETNSAMCGSTQALGLSCLGPSASQSTLPKRRLRSLSNTPVKRNRKIFSLDSREIRPASRVRKSLTPTSRNHLSHNGGFAKKPFFQDFSMKRFHRQNLMPFGGMDRMGVGRGIYPGVSMQMGRYPGRMGLGPEFGMMPMGGNRYNQIPMGHRMLRQGPMLGAGNNFPPSPYYRFN